MYIYKCVDLVEMVMQCAFLVKQAKNTNFVDEYDDEHGANMNMQVCEYILVHIYISMFEYIHIFM